MRLLSQKSREYNGKEYKKFWIVISNKIIEKIGWKTGDELEPEIKGDKLIIKHSVNLPKKNKLNI